MKKRKIFHPSTQKDRDALWQPPRPMAASHPAHRHHLRRPLPLPLGPPLEISLVSGVLEISSFLCDSCLAFSTIFSISARNSIILSSSLLLAAIRYSKQPPTPKLKENSLPHLSAFNFIQIQNNQTLDQDSESRNNQSALSNRLILLNDKQNLNRFYLASHRSSPEPTTRNREHLPTLLPQILSCFGHQSRSRPLCFFSASVLRPAAQRTGAARRTQRRRHRDPFRSLSVTSEMFKCGGNWDLETDLMRLFVGSANLERQRRN